MSTPNTVQQESSVVFNLRELMQLEVQRVSNERERQTAAERERAQRALAEREQHAREQVAARERERARAEAELQAVERAETERQAALLRVRLEAQARERLAGQQETRQHASELVRVDGRRSQRRALAWLAGLALACASAGYAGFTAAEHQLAAVSGSADRAVRLLAAQAREVAQLREQLRAAATATRPAASRPLAPPDAHAARPPAVVLRAHSAPRQRPMPPRTAVSGRDSLDEILDDDSDDPTLGIEPRGK